MNAFLLIIFLLVGVAGLIYKVDTGVFVGLSLIPWQIMRLGSGRSFSLGTIIVTTIAGSIFFILIHKWILLFLFIFIEMYNYWGYLHTFNKNVEEEKNIDKK